MFNKEIHLLLSNNRKFPPHLDCEMVKNGDKIQMYREILLHINGEHFVEFMH